jgi:hypothetical protein
MLDKTRAPTQIECDNPYYVKIAKGIVALSLFQRDIHSNCPIFKVNLPQKERHGQQRDAFDFSTAIYRVSCSILF